MKIAQSIVGLFLLGQSCTALAINLDANQYCGTNNKCIIVDTIDVVSSIDNLVTMSSSKPVYLAWKDLTSYQGCDDVADVVVGGTGSESGQLSNAMVFWLTLTGEATTIPVLNSRPGTFAEHLTNPDPAANRCSIVVNYTLNDTNTPYAKSVETGRRALTVVLGTLDTIRRNAGYRTPVRVWGHSKGAAVVESVWLLEAKNNATVMTDNERYLRYQDPCPSNLCFYYGFGYPYAQEKGVRGDEISHQTAKLWSYRDAGWLKNPKETHNQWQRLKSFSNLSDPVYYCDAAADNDVCISEANDICHDYSGWLDVTTYPTDYSSYYLNYPLYLGDKCGNPGEYSTN